MEPNFIKYTENKMCNYSCYGWRFFFFFTVLATVKKIKLFKIENFSALRVGSLSSWLCFNMGNSEV